MQNELVRYSQAGDAFHYRWAARRCLKMIDPKSSLKCVTIESSKESKAAGEYVIDLAEYSENETEGKTTAYFQLKHTTVRTEKNFTLAEIKSTLAGFAKRYSACFVQNGGKFQKGAVTFSFVSNRPISKRLKQGIDAIRMGSNAPHKLQKDLERITKLTSAHLREFCTSLTFRDGEGDYIVQKAKLRGEMAEYIAGFIDSHEVDNLIALITDRALPESEDHRKNGEVYREDILGRLGVTSECYLFPAPSEFEKLPQIIKREQHESILKHILTTSKPSIIHAAGGVGKSVVARQLVDSLPSGLCNASWMPVDLMKYPLWRDGWRYGGSRKILGSQWRFPHRCSFGCAGNIRRAQPLG